MYRTVAKYYPPVPGTVESGNRETSPIPVTLELVDRSSELQTHSQTELYLWHEPTKVITEPEQFLDHIFPETAISGGWNLELSDLRYDPVKPRAAEGILTDRLNSCILPSSKSASSSWKWFLSSMNPFQDIFLQWPLHAPPPGLTGDCHLDIAVICRDVYSALANIVPQSESSPVCPDVADIQSCIEHTVMSGANGRKHNRHHTKAKINELLKCPLNMSIIVLGLHGSGTTLWYADRCGLIEVDLGNDKSLQRRAVLGLSNCSAHHDPYVTVHRLHPHRIYKFNLRNNVYYGICGPGDEPLYVADGIASRGTLVLPGVRATAFLNDDTAGFTRALDLDIVAIKLSHPSVPWATEFPHLVDNTADAWELEWQVLWLLEKHKVRYVPTLVDHFEHDFSTKTVREAMGLQDQRHRTRTILVTQPLADSTLQKAIECGIELSMLVQVMKDIIDGMQLSKSR